MANCLFLFFIFKKTKPNNISLLDVNIDAPPSLVPNKKYCDITGLEVHFIYLF